MTEHSFEVDIGAPLEIVYDIWVDPARSPEWNEGLTRVTELTGPPGRAGTRYIAWFGGSAASVEVTAGERPRRYAWRVRFGPLAAEFDSTFEPEGSGTRMRETVRTRGPIGWIWNRILSTGSYRGSFRGELGAFAQICERERAAPR